MKALRYHGARDVRYESMDDPTPQSDRDAIIKVDACSICGSDLHIYHGHGFSEDIGFCVGHEAVGEVVEIGRGVSRLKVGDKVMIPAAVGCGACRSCLAGVVGLSAQLQGSQAEAVRVPAADSNAVLIPDGISADQALMMTDALATAWFGARSADIVPGSSVAVIGLGPIALHPDGALDAIKEGTKGRKLNCVVEVVGHDATVDLALRLVRRRGTVSVIGVQQSRRYPFPLERAFAAGLTFRAGTCSVPEEYPALFPLVRSGRLRPEKYISHRLPLSDGAEAYRMFEARETGALKMVMIPD